MPKKVYKSFSDLRSAAVFSPKTEQRKTLCVSTIRRSYLSQMDAVYDFKVGHDMLVTDSASPFYGCTVSIMDSYVLKQHGYTDVAISYNRGLEPVALTLDGKVF
jgi:hypothetical protein